MRFIETPVFTRTIVELLDDDAYWSLQIALMLRPHLGPVIPRSGGLRKVRWSTHGRGKRGGIRIIYFWHDASETFFMLYAYRKNEQEDLTAQQLRLLGRIVREEFG
jgi:mRNA-degrading endonuclease RelE of RelBE toxin-antitoxin system